MFGQLCPLGTGSFNLLLDINQVKDARYVPDTHCISDMDTNIDVSEYDG